MYLIVHSL